MRRGSHVKLSPHDALDFGRDGPPPVLGGALCLGVHLLGCPPCLRFSRAVRWLHRRLSAAPADVRLPAEARDRIARALEQAGRDE